MVKGCLAGLVAIQIAFESKPSVRSFIMQGCISGSFRPKADLCICLRNQRKSIHLLFLEVWVVQSSRL